MCPRASRPDHVFKHTCDGVWIHCLARHACRRLACHAWRIHGFAVQHGMHVDHSACIQARTSKYMRRRAGAHTQRAQPPCCINQSDRKAIKTIHDSMMITHTTHVVLFVTKFVTQTIITEAIHELTQVSPLFLLSCPNGYLVYSFVCSISICMFIS